MAPNPQFLTLLTWKCASRHNGVHFWDRGSTSGRPKVVRTPGVLPLFTSKCASRHNGVHLFDIGTSKSGPYPDVFCHFLLRNCASHHNGVHFFPHLNFQKSLREWCALPLLTSKCASRHNGVHFFDNSTSKSRPRHGVLCHFLLQNVLRATTACTFSTSPLSQKWLRTLTCFATFYFQTVLGATYGVHFFHNSTSKSRPRMSVF